MKDLIQYTDKTKALANNHIPASVTSMSTDTNTICRTIKHGE